MNHTDLKQDFVSDATARLASVEHDLAGLEASGSDPACVDRLFLAVHAMKGTAGYLGLETISSLAHEMETVLNLVRNDELAATPEVSGVLLDCMRMLSSMIDNVTDSEAVDIEAIVADLRAIVQGGATASVQASLSRMLDIERGDGSLAFIDITEHDLVSRQRRGHRVYIVELDPVADVEARGQTLLAFASAVTAHAEVIDGYMSTSGTGGLEDPAPAEIRFVLLVTSAHDVPGLASALDIDKAQLELIATPTTAPWLPGGRRPVESGADEH